jgi:hypothetical protein
MSRRNKPDRELSLLDLAKRWGLDNISDVKYVIAKVLPMCRSIDAIGFGYMYRDMTESAVCRAEAQQAFRGNTVQSILAARDKEASE